MTEKEYLAMQVNQAIAEIVAEVRDSQEHLNTAIDKLIILSDLTK